MQYRTYLVTNIKVNNNEQYYLKLPTVYADYGVLAKPYLRTHAANFLEITYEFTEIGMINRYWTNDLIYQPMIMDLVDSQYTDTVEVSVIPMPMTAMIIVLEQEDIDGYGDDTDLAIFMKLQQYLPIEFLIESLE